MSEITEPTITEPTIETKEKIRGAFLTLSAIAEAIKDLKQVPSGVLYASVCMQMSLETFERIIETLVRTNLVERRGHLLVWAQKGRW